ncbi:ABC transporter permease [Candidatus Pristimantibacillus sp. PTI5]|uniref:ABC transporter permease n=1 Tax=Candidatus Pristimantibacillus sp. PTI5 TaxID=3400422 RepID=UPI003B02C6B9
MIEYALNHPEKLWKALLEHLEMLAVVMIISIILAAILTIAAMSSNTVSKIMVYCFSVIYSIPSPALFALLIPVTGIGPMTAMIVLIAYNQYVLLRNFMAGLHEVDPSIVEAAAGIGLSRMQVLFQVRLPLSTKALFTGVRLAVVSTIGMATIAALINAGGLGSILLDGLRTMNVYKILWGSLLSAGLAIGANLLLIQIEKRI